MGADLADPAVFDDGDPVGVVRGVQAVRDRHDRAPGENRGERPLEVPRRARVEQARRLVQHERVRVEQHEPRERDLLRLRRGEDRPARADGRLEPGRQVADPPPGAGRLERASELVVVGLGAGQAQVVRDRAHEDVVLLGDQRDVPAQVRER